MTHHIHFPKEYERERYQNLHRRQNKKFKQEIYDHEEVEDFLHLYSGEETEEALFRVIGGNEFGYRKGNDVHENKNYIKASEASLPIIDYFSPGAKFTLISGVNGLSMSEDNTPLLHKQILTQGQKTKAAQQHVEKQLPSSNDGNQYHFHVEHGYSYNKIVDTVLAAISENKENEGKQHKKKRYHHIISNAPTNRESLSSNTRNHNIFPSDTPLNVKQLEEILSTTSNTLSSIKIDEIFKPAENNEDRIFLQELQAVFNLPSYIRLHEERSRKETLSNNEDESHLVFVTVDSLNELKRKYGDYSEQVALATKMIDVAFTYLYLELAALSKNDFISGFISTLPTAYSAATRQKRQLQNTVRTEDYVFDELVEGASFNEDIRYLAESSNVTSSEIENVNMVCWTTVILIVITYMAIMILAGSADGPRDPILYAKFQADTGN